MRKKHNKEDIIAVGESLIRKNGYHHTGINDILKASGIPKGSFYNYFATKEDFGKQLIESYGDRMATMIEGMLGDDSISPIERLRAFYQMSIEANKAEDCKNGCLINNLSLEVGGLSEALATAADTQFGKWKKKIAVCIREGQDKGEFIDTYPADELASFIHTNFFGALTRAKVSKSTKPLERALKMSLDFMTTKP